MAYFGCTAALDDSFAIPFRAGQPSFSLHASLVQRFRQLSPEMVDVAVEHRSLADLLREKHDHHQVRSRNGVGRPLPCERLLSGISG